MKVFSGSSLNTLRAWGLTYLRVVLLFKIVFYKRPSVVGSRLEDSLVSPVRLRGLFFLFQSGKLHRVAASALISRTDSSREHCAKTNSARHYEDGARETGIGAEFESPIHKILAEGFDGAMNGLNRSPFKWHWSRTWPHEHTGTAARFESIILKIDLAWFDPL